MASPEAAVSEPGVTEEDDLGTPESGEVVRVSIASLVTGGSPRLSGESRSHVRRLAESEEILPPLLVHRQTMRVVDGMHRLRAAELRGEKEVAVRFVDADEARLFVLAVQANIKHGLPLSMADRKAAAGRIITLYPEWSDRRIASVTGISAKTVAAVRGRPTVEKQQLDVRVGRDGRARPVNGAARREIAARLIADNPTRSLRDVAREAGISPETARSVRAQITAAASRRQPDAGSSSQSPGGPPGQGRNGHRDPEPGILALRALHADPAFHSNERTRLLLRVLGSSLALTKYSDQLVEGTPLHCLAWVADAAHACASVWEHVTELAEDLRRRTGGI